jgi:hypothetical protein
MNGRVLALAVLVGTIVIFAWQTISNAALPWHRMTMRRFANNDSLVRQIRAAAPSNGMYYSNQGVLASVAMTPDFADKTALPFTSMLTKQIAIDVVMAIALLIVVLRMPGAAPLAIGFTLGAAGFAAGVALELSDWNWYGFSAGYTIVNAIDVTIQCFIGGFATAFFLKRFGARAVTEERVGVPAGKGYGGPPSGQPTGSRRG